MRLSKVSEFKFLWVLRTWHCPASFLLASLDTGYVSAGCVVWVSVALQTLLWDAQKIRDP